MKSLQLVLLAAALSGCGGGGGTTQTQPPAPITPVGLQNVKIVNRGPAGFGVIATFEMDAATLKYASTSNGTPVHTWSRAITPEEFSQLKKIAEEENLYVALKVPPNIGSGPCHHEGMEVTLKKDDVATVFPIHYYTVCDTTTNKGFSALYSYVYALAGKYGPI